MSDGEYDACISAGVEHADSISLAQRERLFAEHLLSRGRAGHHLRRMQ